MNDRRKGRILIGEDLRVIALKMSQALERAGYEVEIAGDGDACVRLAVETTPDLVVLDIMMPKRHGIDVLKALRADPRTSAIGVMVCSAKDFKPDRDEANRLGVIEFLIKPLAPAALVEKVDSFFGRRRVAGSTAAAPAASTEGEVYRASLDVQRTHFAIWGARGSTPTVGGRFQRHGGNTSCMSVTLGDEVFVFDAGSGIRDLGTELMVGNVHKIHLFITHTHWDHIQGFPYFAPNFAPQFDITVYGAKGFGKDLESIFRGELDQDYFPVQMDDLKSNLQFRYLPEGPIDIGNARITWEFMQHPGATVGYKIEVPKFKLVWVPDNEFIKGYLGAPTLGRKHSIVAPYEKMITFLSGADLAIHEAQYLSEEYKDKVGWGHSAVSNACLLMKLAGVPRWVVTHHDPMHDDAFLEAKLNLTRQILNEINQPTRVSHAYDGMTEYL